MPSPRRRARQPQECVHPAVARRIMSSLWPQWPRAGARMVATFLPPFVSAHQLVGSVRERGYAVLSPQSVSDLVGFAIPELDAFKPDWRELALDRYLKDGGRYRFRRHSCFVVDDEDVIQAPHRAHWQSLDYNALHGGMQRWFEPMLERTTGAPSWGHLLQALAMCCSALKGAQPWFIEAHQFRIDTCEGIGRPTPEGAHRDGVDFVAVFLVERETRVFEAAGPDGQRFTLETPWSLLFLDDERVIHESTPIQPSGETAGHRDTLVLTFRAAGFQEDA